MELYFATSLKGGEISCSEVSVITGSLEVNVAGGDSGKANKFKAGAYTRPLLSST